MNKKKIYCYDLETLSIFTATFLDRDSDEKRVFVFSNTKDERPQMFEFLSTEVQGLIGYNCLHFDAQILEYMYRYPDCTPDEIRRYAQIITSNNDRQPDVPEWKLKHKHLDLFRALSLSTKAKRVGLKWCEFMMDLDNIEDMPSQGEGSNWEEMVLSYNLNDVIATKELYQKYYHEIELRKQLSKRENLNLLNSTEPDLAKKLFTKYLAKEMKISENDLKSMGTTRDVVKVKDIIFPYVSFKTEKFKNVLKSFESLELKETDKIEFIINEGIDIVYGLGGLHAAPNNVVVESSENMKIKSLDFISWYPNLAIKNGICAKHLPKEVFLNLYEGFFNERKIIPKSDPRNYILKILLNSAYGLSNDKYSFLRDRQVTLAICINGQLLLTMLFEDILKSIPGSKLIMVNTDGCEMLIPTIYEEKYHEICKNYEEMFQIGIEFADYSKMIISDCNNYIAIYTDGKVKTKGKYEYKDIPLYKNKSHSIIPRAVHDYWVKGVPVEKTIKEHTNIFDFCAGVKAKKSDKKGASRYEIWKVEIGKIKKQKLSKTVRYFISKTGGTLIKFYEDNTFAQVEAPIMKGNKLLKEWKVTYFNKAFYPNNFEDYNIDYSYYITKSKEWINDIEQIGQQKLL